MEIPFNRIYYTGKEIEYVSDAIDRGQLSGDGYYTKLVSSLIKERFGAVSTFMTTSATHALELAVMTAGIGPGDEVIMPSFTFPSTANAVLLRGANPVFAEIDEETLNIDIEDAASRITCRTKAVMPVHYGGVCCDMGRLMDMASGNNLCVIEDAAQGVNAKYDGKYLGTIGHFGCYSFHSTKNYICGEGGALIINCDDSAAAETASVIRQKGTNRDKFLLGEVDKYSWVDIGSSYVPSDILMAFLYAQLQHMDIIKNKRKMVHDYYTYHLKKYADDGLVRIAAIPKKCESNYHIYYILLRDQETRDRVMYGLREKGICALTHYVPLHGSHMGASLGYSPQHLPVTERVGRSLLRLPIYAAMDEKDMEYTVKNLEQILEGA